MFSFIHWLGGFLLLHLFSILLIIGTFLVLFKMARKEVGFSIAVLLSIFLIPLMVYRNEIRPEILSCFFSASFFSILWAYRGKNLSVKWLWVLPVLEVVWVNLHIYFFLGPVIVGAFLLEKVIFYLKDSREKLRVIFYTFGSVLLATLINPFGWNNLIYPFLIYNNRSYRVLEEQSVWFIEKLGINNPSFLFFKITLAILLISFVWIIVKKRKKFPLINFFLISGFAFMACWAICNITLFAFMSLPILAKNISIIWPNLNFNSFNKKASLVGISLAFIFVIFII